MAASASSARQFLSIQIEERDRDNEGRALVAIDERMVLRDPACIGGREIEQVGIAVGREVLRPRQCGSETALVAQSVCAAMSLICKSWKIRTVVERDPLDIHFANSRNVLR